MKLSKEEVEYVAGLARLAISMEEKEMFSRQLSDILTHIGKLNELDTSKVKPTSHVLDLHNVLRDDVVRDCLNPDEVLSGTPERDGDYFRVPKIIGEKE